MRWLLSNVRNRAWFAARHPAYAVRSLLREATHADEKFLSSITGCPVAKLRAFMDEPIVDTVFAQTLRAAMQTVEGKYDIGADPHAKKLLLQYASVRAIQPQAIVETGVANGISSAYLLLALHRNGAGHLHSIDIGGPDFLVPGRNVGWAIPDYLRGAWVLHLGDSRVILPHVLKNLGSIDIFIHDSLHAYEHMLWEFRAAYPYLKSGGLLFSDDALWNNAFPEFAAEAGAKQHATVRGVGILKKPVP